MGKPGFGKANPLVKLVTECTFCYEFEYNKNERMQIQNTFNPKMTAKNS
ncbi:hypothetical protein JIR001_26530 [Polycladomyces abyssicola]|uniref:Uncharacterized protein n=1 Tax=Polycladomyces abyssicola TaxID=1125966 RepID=A0A8D5UJE0_9BACL|nr:hypothetical protein JIR001_26530 [Polycladomyces abyssicola]